MQIKHHGLVLYPIIKELKPNSFEIQRGVIKVWALDYRCPVKVESEGTHHTCNRRLLYKQEEFATGCTEMMRIRPGQKIAFIHRMSLAPTSNAVQGTVREKNSGKYMFKSSIRVD